MRKKLRELKDKVPYIEPIEPKLKLDILNKEQIQKIHQATLEILEEVGVHFPSKKALEIFEEAGAGVDYRTEIVKLSSDLIKQAIKQVPPQFTLAGRNPQLDVKVDVDSPRRTYLRTGGCATRTVDFQTRQERSSRASDVSKMAVVADYLPFISIYWPLVSAQDKEKELAPLYELAASFPHTEKHVQTETAVDEKLAYYTIEMGSIIAGGKKELRERSPVSCLICCIQPLAQDAGAIEAGLTYAKAGVPIGFLSMPTMGTTVPASPAGALEIANAEVLSAITLIQLAYPGAPVFYSLSSAMIHPRDAGYLYGNLAEIINPAGAQLAHSYGIPFMTGCSFGGNNHKMNTWQVGIENVYNLLFNSLAGADLAGSVGLMNASNLLYPERILLDNDIFQAVKQLTSGIEVNTETLAIESIKETGPRGHFLTQRFTSDNLIKLCPPSVLFELADVPEERFRNPQETAMEELEWILKNHQPKHLETKTENELKKILQSARKDIVG